MSSSPSQAASGAGKVLPMLKAVHWHIGEAVEAGFGDQVWSAMVKAPQN